MKKALFIVNPVSGKKEILFKFAEVLKIFTDAKLDLELHFTTKREEAINFVKEYSKDKDLIICSGGDGTLNEVVNGVMMHNVKIPIAYIPSGTTNDFASSIGLSNDVVKCAKEIVTGTPHAIDIGRYSDKYFVYVAAFGAFTQSSYSTPQDLKNIFGHFAYIMTGMSELPNIREKNIKITTETKEVFEGNYFLGAISNTRSIAGLIKFKNSNVDLSDGYFELMLIGSPKDFSDLKVIGDFINTKKAKGPLFTFIHAKEFHIESETQSTWSIDGEAHKIGKDETFTNVEKAIQIILPS